MIDIFTRYADTFAGIQEEMLVKLFSDLQAELLTPYTHYTGLDHFYPRPLLTLLGMNCMKSAAPTIQNCPDKEYLLIPQFVRDVLAIHDDIIDGDLEKFHEDTLPFAYSKLFAQQTNDMTKEGRDLALLFGDYLTPKIYEIVLGTSIPVERKLDAIACIDCTLADTNIGQLEELLLQHKKIADCDPQKILRMYRRKAANYCYAFPFELGAVYAGVPRETIDRVRSLLLRIGVASQIVDDFMGVFPEALGEAKFTLSDLLLLRRSYVLALLGRCCKNDANLLVLLDQTECTEQEARAIKEKILSSGTMKTALDLIRKDCDIIEQEIDQLSVGDYCRRYFHGLVRSRIRGSLDAISAYYGLGDTERYQ